MRNFQTNPLVEPPFAVPSPRNYRRGYTTVDGPQQGVGPTESYSLPANAKRPSNMNYQPAFAISAPMAQPQALPDQDLLNALNFGMGKPNQWGGGFPTFFPIGNRAANSVSDPWSGKANGIRMLVVPPTRYNELWRGKFKGPHDVRLPNTIPQLTRARARGTGAGS